jgi:uncharacterized protein (TIGR00730 family)
MRRICIFCGAASARDPQVEAEARGLMKIFFQKKIELVYGGASIGVMGVLANELINLGGRVTGIIPQHLMKKEIAHAGLTELLVVKDMHERKQLMYKMSDAFMVFPGGMGTLDELFEITTWHQLGLHNRPIAILNINGYFDYLLRFLDHAVAEGLVSPRDRQLIFSSSKASEILEYFGVQDG